MNLLKFIFARVTTIYELCSRIQRRLDAIEEHLDCLAKGQREILDILKKLADAEFPDPATSIEMSTGPVQEQPERLE